MDWIRNSLKSMRRKKLRTSLTILGIAIGVLSVVIISMIGEVGKQAVNHELNSMGISGLSVRSNKDGEKKLLGTEELALVQADASVEQATPLITRVANLRVHGEESSGILWGVDYNAAEVVSLELLYGRLIHASDVKGKARVCLVDESFAKKHYFRSNIVGKKVSIQSDGVYTDFEVIGVVASGGNLLQGLMGDVVPTFLYAPYTTLGQLSHSPNFSQIIARLSEDADEAEASQSIIRTLTQSLGLEDSVTVDNLNQQKDRLNRVLDLVALILSVIGGISLVVAGLSIMTVMLVTVHERTREIGIKKSIGASRRTILLEFLIEALLLSLFGSLAGASVGLSLGALGCWLLQIPLAVNWQSVGFCLLFSMGIGAVFGVYPARKAAALRPVQALRQE